MSTTSWFWGTWPDYYWQENVGGFQNLVTAMKQCGVLNLVFSSSAAVYGAPILEPGQTISEFENCSPINPYGLTKLEGEVISQALADLRDAGCDLITITQYLRPSSKHHPVVRWVKPNEFVELSKEAEEIGFLGVMSGPLVRSSYRAGRLYNQAMAARAVK